MNTDIDVKERIDIFLENKTYVYIKLKSGKFFNGLILDKSKHDIEFKDDLLGKIPILIKEIEIIDYSNKKKGGER